MRTTLLIVLLFFLTIFSSQAQFSAKRVLVNHSSSVRSPYSMAVGDLNNDGRPDMVVTTDNSERVFYYTQASDGSFTETALPGTAGYGNIEVVETADLDGNGYTDIIALTNNYNSDNKVLAWYNNGGILPQTPTVLLSGLNNTFKPSFLLNDLNLDGATDIILSSMHKSGKTVWLQNPGKVGTWNTIELNYMYQSDLLLVADLGGNAAPEFYDGSKFYSSNGLTSEYELHIGYRVLLMAADMDHDRDMDIVASPLENFRNITWFENLGNFQFVKHEISNSGGGFTSIRVEDFDKDGLPDIVAGCPTSCQPKLILNKGKGDFQISNLEQFTSGYYNQGAIRIADMDQDGKQDIVTTEYGWRLTSWFKNNLIPYDGVQAGFQADVPSCSLGEVKFFDTSRGQDIQSWAWDFGDGNTATTQNTSHIYTSAGTYEVTLQVQKKGGARSTFTMTVVLKEAPTLEESYELWFCEGQEYVYVNIGEPEEGSKYQWYAPLGSTYYYSIGNGPRVLLKEETWHVEKISPNGCVSKRVPVYVRVSRTPKSPVAIDAYAYDGPAVLRLGATDPDGRQDVSFRWYNQAIGGEPIHEGAFYDRHFSKDESLYVEAFTTIGCTSPTRSRIRAYVHQQSATIPEFVWAEKGGANGAARSHAIARDKAGYILNLGEFSKDQPVTLSGVTISPGDPNKFVKSSYLFRHSPDGKVISGSRILSLLNDGHLYDTLSITYLSIDQESNMLLAGLLGGSAEIGKDNIYSYSDYIILKLGPDGSLLWKKVIGLSAAIEPFRAIMQAKENGSFTITVSFKHQMHVEGRVLQRSMYLGPDLWTQFVLHYTKDGELLSAREIAPLDFYDKWSIPQGAYHLGETSVASDDEDNIYQLGSFKGRTYFPYQYHYTDGENISEVLLFKFSKKGDKVWHKKISSSPQHSTVAKKIIYHDNALYMIGTATGKDNSPTYLGSTWFYDVGAYLMKYDLNGNLIWTKPIERKLGTEVNVYDLLIDNEGSPYVVGTATGLTAFDSFLLRNKLSPGNPFTFIAKYTSDGTLHWAKAIDNAVAGQVSISKVNVAFDKDNFLVLNGNFQGNLTLDGLTLLGNLHSNIFTVGTGYKLQAAMQIDGSCAGQPALFQDQSQDTPTEKIIERNWDFGNGGTASGINPKYSYSKGGVYEVVLTIRGDRGSVNTTRQVLVIKNVPEASISVDGFVLTATEANSYRWFLNDSLLTDSTRVITANEDGRYKVEIEVNGCKSISDEVSIELQQETNKVIGYPNPVKDQLNLQSKQLKMIGYSIYNTKGQLMKNDKLPVVYESAINVSNLPPDLYIIHIELEEDKWSSFKFMKQ